VLLACVLWEELLQALILFYLFVAISQNVREQNVGLNFCHRCGWGVRAMLLSSPIGQIRHPRVCTALIYCRTLTRSHTHSGKLVTEKKFAGNEKFWIFAFKIICLLKNTTHLL
jgi:hypothetical protein